MPRLQHLLAISMVLVEAGIFAYLSESWTVPILASVVAALSWVTPWRLPLKPSQRFVGALGLAVPFTFQWAFTPYEPTHLRLFILYPLAHAGGQYGLALQASYLWAKEPRESWSAQFPLCGICVLMAAADVQTTTWQSHVFQVAVLAFLLQTAGYYSAARLNVSQMVQQRFTGRLTLLTATILVTCIVSVIGSLWLERSWTTIERFYTEWMMGGSSDGSTGFSRQARLGHTRSQSSATDQITALRIYSKDEPGYLRGAAFTRFFNGNWTNDSPRSKQNRSTDYPAELKLAADQPVFHLPGTGLQPAPQSQAWRSLEVWPSAAVGADAVFCPLETEWVSLSQAELEVDPHGIAYPNGQHPDSGVQCFMRQVAATTDQFSPLTARDDDNSLPPDADLEALLALPEKLDPRIVDIALKIYADAPTPDLKVLETARWFKKNYYYELGMEVPAGHDPLTYFLTRRPAAHCEYFATGTVILLRLGGVPCRYVTGFVSTEYNYFGGYWLARNKDAHAWVEAWVPDRGWVIVESTPAAGVPHSNHAIMTSHLWDDLLMRVQVLRSQLSAGTWRGLLRAVQTVFGLLLTTPHGWLMLTGLLVWGVVLWRRHVRFTFRRKYDPISAEFHQLLHELDRRLERLKLRRPSWETLSQFAIRLSGHPSPAVQTAAEWYQDYCEIRYRTDSIPLEIRRLKDSLPQVVKGLQNTARQ